MNDGFNPESMGEAAMVAASRGYDREPIPEDWGFESYGDASPAIGGGVGGFTWFESKQALLDFMARHLVWFSPGPTADDQDAVADEVAKVVEESVAKGRLPGELPDLLNGILKGYSQLRWVGQFSELLESDAQFPREVRSWHRGDEVADASTAIAPDEVAGFVQALHDEWGL